MEFNLPDSVKALVLCGGEDELIRPSVSREVADRSENFSFFEIAGADHNSILEGEHFNEVLKHINGFASELFMESSSSDRSYQSTLDFMNVASK